MPRDASLSDSGWNFFPGVEAGHYKRLRQAFGFWNFYNKRNAGLRLAERVTPLCDDEGGVSETLPVHHSMIWYRGAYGYPQLGLYYTERREPRG